VVESMYENADYPGAEDCAASGDYLLATSIATATGSQTCGIASRASTLMAMAHLEDAEPVLLLACGISPVKDATAVLRRDLPRLSRRHPDSARVRPAASGRGWR
jgi:hypothetical protein